MLEVTLLTAAHSVLVDFTFGDLFGIFWRHEGNQGQQQLALRLVVKMRIAKVKVSPAALPLHSEQRRQLSE